MGTVTDEAELERIVLENPHVVAIHPGLDVELPLVNPLLFNLEEKRYQRLSEFIKIYLEMPLIEDDFGSDHLSRRKGIRFPSFAQYGKKIWYYLNNNALRMNSFLPLLTDLDAIRRAYIGPNPEDLTLLVNSAIDIIPHDHKEYDLLSTNQKIELVNDLKQRLYGVWQYLSEQTPLSEHP